MKSRHIIYPVIAIVILVGWAIMRRVALETVVSECDRAGNTSIAACTELIRRDPRDRVAYYNRGNGYVDKGDYERAIGDYTNAIEINRFYSEAYNGRGYAYALQGDNTRAIADFTKATEINPRHALAYNNRGWAYLQIGNAFQGLPDVERSLQLDPNDARALDTRGHILEALGRRDEAIADYRRALAKDTDHRSSKEAMKRLGVTP